MYRGIYYQFERVIRRYSGVALLVNNIIQIRQLVVAVRFYRLPFLPCDGIDHQSDGESTALVHTGRVHTNLAILTLDDLLHNVEAEADTLVINCCGPLQLAKACKEQRHIL